MRIVEWIPEQNLLDSVDLGLSCARPGEVLAQGLVSKAACSAHDQKPT